MAMAKIVEADLGQVLHPTHEIGELVSEASGLFWLSILTSTHKPFRPLPNAKAQQALGLLALPTSKLINRKLGQRNGSGLICLS